MSKNGQNLYFHSKDFCYSDFFLLSSLHPFITRTKKLIERSRHWYQGRNRPKMATFCIFTCKCSKNDEFYHFLFCGSTILRETQIDMGKTPFMRIFKPFFVICCHFLSFFCHLQAFASIFRLQALLSHFLSFFSLSVILLSFASFCKHLPFANTWKPFFVIFCHLLPFLSFSNINNLKNWKWP